MKRRGSMTVEASYLMPMILIVIIMLEFLFFYAYDKVALWGNTYYMALKVREQESENITYNMQQEWKTLCEQTLVLYQNDSVTVKKGTADVNVTGKMVFQVPFWGKVSITEQSSVPLGSGKKQAVRIVKWKKSSAVKK